MIAMAEELASRGYAVSFVIHEVAKEWLSNANIQVIPWQLGIDSSNEAYTAEKESFWGNLSKEPNSWRVDKLMLERVINFYALMYESLEKILQQHRPDCLIIDRAVIPAIDLAQRYNLPFIIQTRFLGNFVKADPKYPEFGATYSIRMNLWQKCLNFLSPRLKQIYLLPSMLKLNQIRQEYANQEGKSSLLKTPIIIVGTSFEIEIPRPLPPNVHLVGPIFPKNIKPLSNDLCEWFESDQSRLVVYIAFGTLVTLNPWQAKALVEGLTDPKIRVLWSLPESQQSLLPPLPDSFRIESFVPQQTVLSHPKIALFVNHCGMNSINEALYHGKPILALPFFGDQHYNAARLVDLGVALKLDKRRFSGADVRHKVNQILYSQNYQDSASRISQGLQLTSGLHKSAEIVEAVLQTTQSSEV